jgi:RND family efflux transporter MFP subunit
VLRAPFAGVISVREVDPAMAVAAGQRVFEMDSKEAGLRVEVQMPETQIERIEQGDEVAVSFPSMEGEIAGRTYRAFVSEVGTRAGGGNAFPVRADLAERPSGVRPGMTAEVTFTLGRLDALEGFMIPIGATLAEADDRFSVFVYDPETSRVDQRPVRTGGLRDNDVAVLEGLSEGEIIATAGVSFLRDGQTVTLLDKSIGSASR